MFLAYWLKPLIAGIFLNILMICKVLHPTVLGSTVPMLYAFWNFNYHAGFQLDGWLSPFLVPSDRSRIPAPELDCDEYASCCGIQFSILING